MFDVHCHILPGLDDGSPTMETSLELARQEVASGVTHVVATPHGSSQDLVSRLAQRDALLSEFREKLSAEKIPLVVLPGLEYYADGHSATAALDMPSCLCGNPGHSGNPLLLEIPFTMEIETIENVLFNAQLKEVPLVFAHPERYAHFAKKRSFLESLLDKGLYLQFNSCDFGFHWFGNGICNTMLKLIQYAPQQILVGSDAHHPDTRPAGLNNARETVTERLGKDIWQIISVENPCELFGKDATPLSP